MRIVIILLFFFLQNFLLVAQTQTPVQTVRGTIVDDQTKTPLVGAIVVLNDTGAAQRNTTSDVDGNFRMENVAVGRHNLLFRFVGYKDRTYSIVVTSGKEVILTVELTESVATQKEVVITDESSKTKSINEMATVSARTFTIEETSRYAGSLGDPSRMAANYAGVSGADDSRNDVVIRGNSPLGVLWRLNGSDIPNPNHFGSFGSTGGPVSMLNNNVLDNSDFMTSAFPAEYGNAVAGVFDLRMRNGNNEKFEFLGQMGFNGFEGGIEGPFTKQHNASFLINYRYSTLAVFQKLGEEFGIGDAVPKYQDCSFKLNFPTKKFGDISVWGVGGLSFIALYDSHMDSTKLNLYDQGGYDTNYGTRTGMTGITHTYIFNSTLLSKFNLSVNGMQNFIKQDSFSRADHSFWRDYGSDFRQEKFSANYVLLKKFNAKNTWKSGITATDIFVSLHDSTNYSVIYFRKIRNINTSTFLLQAFSQWQHKFSDRITLNAGVHWQLLTLNDSWALEPRVGIRYELNDKNAISIGGGMHSQMQTVFTYFNQTLMPDGSYTLSNKNIGFTKAIHTVLAYDWNFAHNFRLKSEIYYQYLYDIPTLRNTNSYSGLYSGLNEGADFDAPGIDSLQNKGTGRNYGLELTVEKFYSKGYYFLVTTSLFKAYFTPSDGKERQTAFSGNYVVNVLGGKEFHLNSKNTISVDLKMNMAGGKRFIPVDLAASGLAGEEVLDFSHAYENRYAGYFRMDGKIGFIHNGKHITQQFSVEMMNFTNNRNVFSQDYNKQSNSVVTNYQTGFLAVPSYKISF
ncbi:MAG: TonB-dependent receptor [Bacteroidetes bacterium]|nr:TonB-dependent receptor [Bacteroidota bacterium]